MTTGARPRAAACPLPVDQAPALADLEPENPTAEPKGPKTTLTSRPPPTNRTQEPFTIRLRWIQAKGP